MPEISSGLIGDFPYNIWKHDAMGHLCGYLGIPPGHLWYNKHYDEIDADVHGGLTFAGKENGGNYSQSYPMDIWWIGFDCAHLGDWTIMDDKYRLIDNNPPHKWTRDEVFNELVQLAEQAYAQTEITTNGL